MALCFFCEFCPAGSECEAQVMALEISLQFMLVEVGCADSEIEFKIHSSNIISWLKGDMQADWELRFTRNFLLNRKDWLSNLVVSLCKKSKFKWFNYWCSMVIQSENRTVRWYEYFFIVEYVAGAADSCHDFKVKFWCISVLLYGVSTWL